MNCGCLSAAHKHSKKTDDEVNRVNRRDETRTRFGSAATKERASLIYFSLSIRVCTNRLISAIETMFCARYLRSALKWSRCVCVCSWAQCTFPQRQLFANAHVVVDWTRRCTFCSHVCKKRKKKNRVKMVEPIDCCYYYWIYMHRRAPVQPIAERFAIESWNDRSEIRTTPCAT